VDCFSDVLETEKGKKNSEHSIICKAGGTRVKAKHGLKTIFDLNLVHQLCKLIQKKHGSTIAVTTYHIQCRCLSDFIDLFYNEQDVLVLQFVVLPRKYIFPYKTSRCKNMGGK
jgi:hypothetical protein